jgi:selenide,water dikinase
VAMASNVCLRIAASKIPLLPGALECVRAGYIPGGLKANREFAECAVEFSPGVPDELRTIVFDPQTAGGLLISLGSNRAEAAAAALSEAGVHAVVIGEVLPRVEAPALKPAPALLQITD